ncbi:MAG: PAS domain S-box protein [Bacteroidales bacterium]|nr:PAS domain S-box protein [Bacteroidales bacterium]
MSMQDFEDKRLEDRRMEEDHNKLESGQNAGRPDKKLLLGTVQFYEDILLSLYKSLIVVYNSDGKHIEVWGDANLKKILGIQTGELKGKLLEDILPELQAAEFKNYIKKVFDNNQSEIFNINLDFPKGSFWLEVSLSPLSDSNGKTSAVVGYLRDITDTVQHEKDLITSKEKYQNLVNLAPDGILTVNLKGIVTSVNTTLLNISGFQEEDLTGKKLNRLPIFGPQNMPQVSAIIETINSRQHPGNFEFEWTNNLGEKICTEVHSSPIKKNERLSGFQFTLTDITEKKNIVRDLLKSKQAYKVIIENAHEAIYVIQNDQIRFCNSKLLELVKHSMDELLNINFYGFIHPDEMEYLRAEVNEHLTGKVKQKKYVFRVLDKNSETRWLENTAVLIDWENKPALLAFANDITDFKVSEEKERKHLTSLEFISQKAMEFVELNADYNVYKFLGEKIKEIIGESIILLVSYDKPSDQTKIEHIEGQGEFCDNLLKILTVSQDQVNVKINHELLRNLSYGKLIKYNDGLFEKGYSIFLNNTYKRIQSKLEVGGIFLIGLTWENTVYGNAMIFLPKGKQLENPEAIETVVKLGSIALQRKKAEDALRHSEEKYRRIFESYQDVYFKTDIDGLITEISPSVGKIGGYERNDIQGRFIQEFFVEKSITKSLGKILLKNESIIDQDIKLIKKNGSLIDASLNARLLRDQNGNPTGSEGVIRDISERKKAETDFQKSEEKFRTLANFTYDWEYWVAPDHKIIYMSPSCLRSSGYSADEFTNDPDLLIRITHPDDRETFKKHLQDEVTFDEPLKFDYRIITKTGETKWLNHNCQKVYGVDGRYLGRRASNRDITDRKAAEEQLRNSEERFRTLFFESPDAVFVEDYEGNILDVNPAACKLHKMEKNELVGKNILDIVPSSHVDKVAEEFPKWITGEIVNHRGYSKASDGECFPVEIRASKINYSDKKALLFIVRDITLIQETEDKLKEAVAKAEEADMLKSVFLANMSHEIRTPMNAIIGFSEILSDQELTKKEREEFINYITQGSNTLMNLIEDIIDITKIEAGQIKINFAEIDVDKLMDELYATFLKMKNKNGQKNVELHLNKPGVEEGFKISTDPSRIRQILSNLIGNALKFTDEGYIEIGFNLAGANQIIFYVKDTGIGIPDDKLDLIFERFGQVEDAKKTDRKGTGLGLSISKKLAGLLGGDLTVESELHKGSIFYLTLPINKDLVIDTPPVKQPRPELKDWSDKLFLIAEDSILNYTYLEALFQKTKVKLLWAKDGQEAIEMCRKNKEIDLVLMDIKMPIINGLQAISEIKKFRKNLPIIVQTAYAMPEDREKSLDAGGDEHLTKPINAEELFNTIHKFLK